MLKSVKKIETPLWMSFPDVQYIMEVLNSDKKEPSALFVGGCVRNTLLGKRVTDIDIACKLEPESIIKKLEFAQVRVIPTGVKHGTVTAVVEHRPFEITTLRKDIKTDGRRAEVEFTTDWTEDAKRRDFTINTLLSDIDGTIYDPTGCGIQDLKQHVVRFVGDPEQRVTEDYLRILRFFRFYGIYGVGLPDEAAFKACKKHAERIKDLSKERITSELFKILSIESPATLISLMQKANILSDLIPVSYSQQQLELLCSLQRVYEYDDILARLLLITGVYEGYDTCIRNNLILSRNQTRDIDHIVKAFHRLKVLDEKSASLAIYKFGRYLAWQAIFLKLALEGQSSVPRDMILFMERWQAPSFPITGEDVQAFGVEQGPEIGRLLIELEEWWLDNDMAPERAACLHRLDLNIKSIHQ